ncbi:MAG TPA: PIG-L family deacetylase [Candidatus Methanoperedenaceae archaeon]|nr:PIG-L family deacetylase [Candidatus Methanoperedenaceae archaeon]
MTERILVLSPHTDDGELGCGGSIAKFVETGKDVHYVALSCCEKSVPPEYPCDILKTEVRRATGVLGLGEPILYDFEVREFPRLRQEILDTLIDLRKKLKPDLVLTPSTYDTHQDHKTVTEEVHRAFKKCAVLGYEQPWNNMTFQTSAFVSLDERHITRKINALRCYETQKHRAYLNSEFIKGLAITRGTQMEEQYAEAFEVIRWVIR